MLTNLFEVLDPSVTLYSLLRRMQSSPAGGTCNCTPVSECTSMGKTLFMVVHLRSLSHIHLR